MLDWKLTDSEKGKEKELTIEQRMKLLEDEVSSLLVAASVDIDTLLAPPIDTEALARAAEEAARTEQTEEQAEAEAEAEAEADAQRLVEVRLLAEELLSAVEEKAIKDARSSIVLFYT